MTSGPRVLIIDDDEAIRSVTQMALEDEGFEVLTAPDGLAGLRAFAENRPDVVLLDMKMPVMDGWEFASQYKALSGKKAPIVVFTAARSASQWADEIGADAYIEKPFDLDHLIETLRAQASPAA